MDKIGVLYGPGAYGTFFSWCLEYFTNQDFAGPSDPFLETGSAHKHNSPMINDVPGGKDSGVITSETYLSSQELQKQITRRHLWLTDKDIQDKDVSKERHILETLFDKRILILPTENTLLLMINNAHSKIGDVPDHRFQKPLSLDLEKWGVTDWDHAPTWVRREWLSLYARDWARDSSGLNHHDEFKKFCHVIELDELFNNFEDTLCSAIRYIGRDTINEGDIRPIFERWSSLQTHYKSDDRMRLISDAIIRSQEIEWPVLTLMEEAWLQMLLRDAGYELKCDGLDVLPRRSKELRELIYAT